MLINWALKEINLKIVYYGPALSGKTTNLEFIYRTIDPNYRGELISLKTREERTIFFDFMQIELAPIQGKRPKFSLYTVPGQDIYATSRRIIMNGVDGIVFVADSQKTRLTANLASLLDLEKNLIRQHRSLENVPHVFQFNKRDLPNILPLHILENRLNFHRAPSFPSIALRGENVSKTLKTIIQQVVTDVERKLHA